MVEFFELFGGVSLESSRKSRSSGFTELLLQERVSSSVAFTTSSAAKKLTGEDYIFQYEKSTGQI